jgi:predicted alpha/beta-fold hydrolase
VIALPDFDPPPFVPPRWLAGGHAQTIVGGLGLARRRPMPVEADEEVRTFRVEDGIELTALCNWLPEPRGRRTLVAVHGLTGDARSGYMVGLAQEAARAGRNTVRVNLRGAGESEEASPSIYNAGVSGDLLAVLRALAEEGFERVTAVGFSLGGNVALKLAGELGSELAELVDGLVAISAPIDLSRCADELDRTPMNRLYQRVFLRDLRAKLRRLHARLPERFPVEGLDAARSMREFDDRFTAPLGGYGDAATYYERCSAARLLRDVAVPALLVQARDDSFIPFDSFEDGAVAANARLRVLATDRGGHNAFYGARRRGERSRFWAEGRAVDFAAALDGSPRT